MSSSNSTVPRLSQTNRKSISKPIDRKNTMISTLWIGRVLWIMTSRTVLLPMMRPARNAP